MSIMTRDIYLNLFILLTLIIAATSSLYLSQESTIKNVGDTFIVICKDKTGGSPVSWRGPNNLKLGPRTRPKVQTSSFGTAIMFSHAVEEDSGNYTCSSKFNHTVFSLKVEAEFSLPTTTDTEQLITGKPNNAKDTNLPPPVTPNIIHVRNRYTTEASVKADLLFKDTPTVQYVTEGTDGNLRCEVNKKDATIVWYFENNTPINSEGSKYKVLGDGLLIRNVSREDGRNYICMGIHQSSGLMKNCSIAVIVRHGPKVYAEAVVVYGFPNQEVNLTCEVEAEPRPEFKWYIVEDDEDHEVVDGIFDVSTHVSVLQVNITEGQNASVTYKCVASNEFGEEDVYFEVQEIPEPGPPTNLDVTDIKSDSIQLNIGLPEVSKELKSAGVIPNVLRVEYRNQSSEEWLSQEFAITNLSSVQVLLKNLQKNTTYEIQVSTKNDGGFSNVISVLATTSRATRSVHTTMSIFSVLLVCLSILLSSEMRKA